MVIELRYQITLEKPYHILLPVIELDYSTLFQFMVLHGITVRMGEDIVPVGTYPVGTYASNPCFGGVLFHDNIWHVAHSNGQKISEKLHDHIKYASAGFGTASRRFRELHRDVLNNANIQILTPPDNQRTLFECCVVPEDTDALPQGIYYAWGESNIFTKLQ